MALKFLNKKGWHTGSLRNIENVWKAEQKHDAEQKKLEELRKQIQQERERSDFRLLQEQAGLVPRQERLEFLYESGLAVGKGSTSNSDGFKAALEPPPPPPPSSSSLLPQPPSSSSGTTQQQPQQQAAVPGALFEEKPQSANDTWRKLHSDPLLLIRQREQESLARVKNNPVQMAIIRNSVEANKSKEKSQSKDLKEKKHHKKKQKHHKNSSSVGEEERTNVRVGKRGSKGDELSVNMDYASGKEQRKKHPKDLSPSVEEEERSKHSRGVGKGSKDERSHKMAYVSEIEERDAKRNHRRHHRGLSSVEEEERLKYTRGAVRSSRSDKLPDKMDYEREDRRRNYERDNYEKDLYRKQPASAASLSTKDDETKRNLNKPKYDEKDKKLESRKMTNYESDKKRRREVEVQHSHHQASSTSHDSSPKLGSIRSEHQRRPHHHAPPPRLSTEERAARLREMQMDAELHEENRWKRIKKADEIDTVQEAAAAAMTGNNTASGSRNFLDAAKRSVYGAEKGGSATIEESVRRRTHYLQSRSEVDQGNAFRR